MKRKIDKEKIILLVHLSERNNSREPKDEEDAKNANADENVTHLTPVLFMDCFGVFEVFLCLFCVALRFDKISLNIVKDFTLLLD